MSEWMDGQRLLRLNVENAVSDFPYFDLDLLTLFLCLYISVKIHFPLLSFLSLSPPSIFLFSPPPVRVLSASVQPCR